MSAVHERREHVCALSGDTRAADIFLTEFILSPSLSMRFDRDLSSNGKRLLLQLATPDSR